MVYDLADIKDKIFVIRAKDELGQYLDDEQAWRAEAEFTSEMEARLEALVREASTWVDKFLTIEGQGNPSEEMKWLLAKKSVELILRRRGGEDYKDFQREMSATGERVASSSHYVLSDKTKFTWFERW